MDFYNVTQDSEEADYFSRAQHSGSLGPAVVLSKLVDLKGRRNLLDVAGGSGAFSITLCRRYPDLAATIMDFPAVEPTARRFVTEARLEDRIRFFPGNALEVAWPADQDVVLISYLMSSVPGSAISSLLAQAIKALRPGGLLIVHDFMVNDEGTGPTSAALWQLCGLLIDPDAELLAPASLSGSIARAGFDDVQDREVIPTITRMITAVRPGGGAEANSDTDGIMCQGHDARTEEGDMATNGSFYWNELMTRDAEAAKKFYGATLGWTFEPMERGRRAGLLAGQGGRGIGRRHLFRSDANDQDTSEGWFAYVAVNDLSGALARATMRRRRSRARALGCAGRRPHRDRQRQCRQHDGLDDAERAVGLSRPRHPAQREIDPPALGQQRRGAGQDAVDAVKGEPAFAAEHHGVA